MYFIIPPHVIMAAGTDRNRAFDIFSVAGALAVIVGIMVLAHYATRWYARRSGPSYGGKYIRIIDRALTGNGASVVIACVDGRYLLLGVSDKNIQLLCELEDFEEDGPLRAEIPFSSLLGNLMKKGGLDSAKLEPEQNGRENGDRQ